jgi:hypothetical protein
LSEFGENVRENSKKMMAKDFHETNMQTESEFAEQYTKAEAIRLVVIGTLAGALVVIASKAWLFPSFREFVIAAPLHHGLRHSGIDGALVWRVRGHSTTRRDIGRRHIRLARLQDTQRWPLPAAQGKSLPANQDTQRFAGQAHRLPAPGGISSAIGDDRLGSFSGSKNDGDDTSRSGSLHT